MFKIFLNVFDLKMVLTDVRCLFQQFAYEYELRPNLPGAVATYISEVSHIFTIFSLLLVLFFFFLLLTI